ncbi:MAG: ribonuclease H family protein [Solirubrobacteraceae bacterium]
MTIEKRKAPRTVEPLDTGTLAARRPVILAKRRARRLAKPTYINTDASWKRGIAGLAYVSGSLGNRTYLVECGGATEAEYLALLMAMQDAEGAELPGPIDFRLDCTAVVHLAVGSTPALVGLRRRVQAMLSRHREWRLIYVERRRNFVADRMARRTLSERR